MKEASATSLFPTLDTASAQLNWLTSIAGRVGYAWERWLAYAKGGWAGGEVRLTLWDQSAGIYAAEDQWANGWTVGGGLEYRATDWLSVGLVYDYADLSIDNKSITCMACAGAGAATPIVDGDVRVQSLMARIGLHQ